jgi:hypothetical protein
MLDEKKGSYLGYYVVNRHGHEAPHLRTRDSGKLSHVSEYVSARFGLVTVKLMRYSPTVREQSS